MQEFINKNINFNSFIEYSKNSIVSKIIYKSAHTILTLFALDQGQSIAEHITPFDAMVQIIDGEAELTIGGEKKLVKAGEAIIMPANIPHALFAKTSYKMLLTMMK
ncbi:MAG TPA: cupin domain-containing protein [Coxiellaceae bacterium]|nr:MAG: cupin [Gammaproteobacteria bacterium RBG_16_37_9]HBC72074.1 cupin domain-containing protein [Coxiellaceae bacterium]